MVRFEDLEVWKKSAALSSEVYKYLSGLKDFDFRSQITRSGLSISSNIAEGYERESPKEVVNFLNYAKASCGELRSQIYIGMKIGYIDKEVGKTWVSESERISKMLYRLMEKLKKIQ